MMKNEKNIYVNNTKKLWKEIKKRANFEDSDYDKTLLKDLKNNLNIDENGEFETEIESIQIETFLDALLSAVEPFSLMMSDLLELFERVGAQKGDNNLQIEIDFGKLKNKFRFDINNFRQSVEKFEKTYNARIRENKIKNPFKMSDIFGYRVYSENEFISKGFDKIAEWIRFYNDEKWVYWFPRQPYSGIKKLDELIRIFWELISHTYFRIGKACNFEGSRRQGVGRLLNKINSDGITDSMLCAESDCIIRSMVIGITQKIIEIKLPQFEAKMEAEELTQKIKSYLNSLDIQYYSVKQKKELIFDLFNLPVWNHRYELYSAWVFTLIVKAFGDCKLDFHLKDGVLSFSFGGSHLATCKSTFPELEIYAELKTKAIANLISKKRKDNIQPDYSIAFNPVNEPNNSVAVIECKQYKKSSVSNFSEAVIDYANNRPDAKIFLVNYGNISKRVNSRICKQVSNGRYNLVEYVKPQSAEANGFVYELKEVIEKYLNRFIAPCTISLKWGNKPSDLDLELLFTNDSSSIRVNYQNTGNQASEPYAVLDHDDRDGNGNETITVYQWAEGQYDIYVNNYSGEKTLDGNIELTISSATFEKVLKLCLPFTKEYCWHVLKINNGFIEMVDKIELCESNKEV